MSNPAASARAPRRALPTPASLAARARTLGARQARPIRPARVVTAPWVRLKCQYGCGGWRSSLCCPPHTPTPAEMRAILDSYRIGVLFEGEGTKKIAATLEREAFLSGYYQAFGLGAGPCPFCRQACAFDEGCRHPERARPSMEACGVDVYATARRHGFTIEVVPDEQAEPHYFGLLLLE